MLEACNELLSSPDFLSTLSFEESSTLDSFSFDSFSPEELVYSDSSDSSSSSSLIFFILLTFSIASCFNCSKGFLTSF